MLLLAGLILGLALGGLLAWLYARGQTAALAVELEHERARAEEKVALLQKTEQDVAEKFDALAANALRKNNESFLELASGQGAADRGLAQEDEHRGAAARAVAPPGLRDAEGEHPVAHRDRRALAHRGARADDRAAIVRGARRLGPDAAAERGRDRRHARALRLHRGGHDLEPTGARSAPDMVVRLPGGRQVVVDAKTPLKPLLDASADPDGDQDRYVDDFVRHVRQHAKQLSEKAYWQQFDDAPDYVFMFLPGESFFRTAIERDPSLLELAGKQRVILVSPMMLITLCGRSRASGATRRSPRARRRSASSAASCTSG